MLLCRLPELVGVCERNSILVRHIAREEEINRKYKGNTSMKLRSFCSVFAAAATLMAPAAKAETVHASWYGGYFHGRLMANGIPFNQNNVVMAAHKTLPFCTQVTLKNPDNDRKITVVVTDRGPFVKGRDFDLSRAGAQKLDFINSGVEELQVVQVIPPAKKHRYGNRCAKYLG